MHVWRPENWKNRYSEELKRLALADEGHPDLYEKVLFPREEAFERGADAMLEAIWKLAEESPTKTFMFDSNHYQIYKVEEVK